MSEINTIPFNNGTPSLLKSKKYGTDWPVVYIINNDNEAYIGETTNASIRANQHLANDIRRKLNKFNIIGDDTFNKSSILDLESFLIKYMSADEKFKLQNGNGGLQNHNYYQREMYEKKFKEIWIQLKSKGLVNHDIKQIANSDIFKYSPYKSLTVDQYMIVNDILSDLANLINKKEIGTFLVEGGAGTGKTILGIYLLKLLCQKQDNINIEIEEDEVEKNLNDIININNAIEDLKIGLVIPMDNLRTTLKKVFKNIKGLSPKMLLSPHEVGKNNEIYDLLIVDEAHRLKRRFNLAKYDTFDEVNNKLGFDIKGTELDWILAKSKYQILFYDENQSVRSSDIRSKEIDKIKLFKNFKQYYLNAQLRCIKGGNEYIDYIKNIFSNNKPNRKVYFKEYDFKIFDNVNDMVNTIKNKDKEYGLCRNTAGYAWKWNTKNIDITKNKEIYDIEIEGYTYIWNSVITNWIYSNNAINEIGCIHTVQGYDLNYAGVIIGNELKYDLEKECFIVDKKEYKDKPGKTVSNYEELVNYILNIYQVLTTRGMLGTYIYACDKGLREYLKRYINEYK